jgi:hypothetical protein
MKPNDENIAFLTNKIMQIKTALCYIEHEYFSLRTHIVQMLYSDDEGNLYFTLAKPLVGIEEIKKFGINLTFYRKNFGYYVQLKAIATVEPDHESASDNDDKYILIKAKITEAEYMEQGKPFAEKRMVDNVRSGLLKFTRSLAMLFY